MATDLADYLVDKGITFREAHGVVGSLVRECEVSGTELNMLPFKTFAAAHAAFGQDVFESLSAVASVERRDLPGGTGPKAVQEQIASARAAIGLA